MPTSKKKAARAAKTPPSAKPMRKAAISGVKPATAKPAPKPSGIYSGEPPRGVGAELVVGFEPRAGGLAKKDRITHRFEITTLDDIDAEVERWLRRAYELDG